MATHKNNRNFRKKPSNCGKNHLSGLSFREKRALSKVYNLQMKCDQAWGQINSLTAEHPERKHIESLSDEEKERYIKDRQGPTGLQGEPGFDTLYQEYIDIIWNEYSALRTLFPDLYSKNPDITFDDFKKWRTENSYRYDPTRFK